MNVACLNCHHWVYPTSDLGNRCGWCSCLDHRDLAKIGPKYDPTNVEHQVLRGLATFFETELDYARDDCLPRAVLPISGVGLGAMNTWVQWIVSQVAFSEERREEEREEPDLSRLTASDPLRLSRDRDFEATAIRAAQGR